LKILNIGCGTKTSDSSEVINMDWSIYLRIKNNRLLRALAPLFFRGERLANFYSLPNNIMVQDISTGIPFESDSVDVVYHSHFLEHFDRDVANRFLLEVKRVLKPGGIHRIVVPDLEKICKNYISHISECEISQDESNHHDLYISAIIGQSVQKEAFGTSKQKFIRRFIENLLLGDARRRGQTHQWMYDRINLKTLLINLGHKDVHTQDYNLSSIPNWEKYGLDLDEKGDQYKPESLYIEAVK
jgi:SAM-dependent methyltransferase